MQLPDLLNAAYRLFPPFIGLVSWKYKVPASALYHSLSVAAIAGGIAELLTDDQDEIDLATYCGLAHDYYQKATKTINRILGGSPVGSFGKEDAREVLSAALSDIVESNVLRDILRLTNYNIAENPASNAWNHSAATFAIWLADTVASVDSALLVQGEVYSSASKLADEQRKLLDSLSIDVVSVSIPQVALRSLMYAKLYETVKDRAVPVLARDGLVIIRRSDEQLKLSIDIDEFRATDEKIILVKEKVCSKSRASARGGSEGEGKKKKKSPEEKFKEMYKPEVVTKGSGVEVELDESVRNALINVELTGVKYTRESPYRCLLCGYPVPDPLHPGWYGYTVYGESTGLERWSPRVPPHVNLNYAFREDYWLRNNLVLCPLCVLDAFAYREVVGEGGFTFVIQFYFPLPTHYEVARYMSTVAKHIVHWVYRDGKNWKSYFELLRLVEHSFESCASISKFVIEEILGDKEAAGSKKVLVDSTWATVILPIKKLVSPRGQVEENKELAFCLPAIALISYLTGLYPARFSSRVEPAPERGLLSPVKPLYDFDPTSREHLTDTPLVLLALATLSTMADEEAEPGTSVDWKERVRVTLEYLDYPSNFYTNVLLNHRVGRKGLDAYRALKSDPVGFYRRYISGNPSPTA